MIKILRNIYSPTYEYLYLFVMVIYMAQMTPVTGRMVGTLSGDPIPFLIPIVLTVILLIRNPINFFNRNLIWFTCIMLCWSTAICYKFHDFSSSNLSYYFFLLYAIIIAYIHIRVYGRDLFLIYEHIMVVMSAISLVFWGIAVLLPYTNDFFHLFPETSYGNNVLYLFNWMDPAKGQIYGSLIRNAGCSWEPGRFAIMLIPAILINLSCEGVKFRKNKRIIILLAALASTMSTTGYSIAILLYAISWFKKVTVKKTLYFIVLILPICWYLFSLDFMVEKIQDNANYEELSEERMGAYDYYNKAYGDEYLGSLDRFESASFDWINFQQEPLLGYGRNADYSWFQQEITRNFVLTGGLVKILSQYGSFIGFLLYMLLFHSSFKTSRLFPHQRSFALAMALVLCSVSYLIFSIPIFTAFWLYGLFCNKNDKSVSRILLKQQKLISLSKR